MKANSESQLDYRVETCDKGDLVLQLGWAGAGGGRGGEKRKKKNHSGSLWLSYFADLLKCARGRQ